jgi:hypothetical protein
MYSTRSVGMNLARPFKAGNPQPSGPASRSDVRTSGEFNRRYATGTANNLIPALKGRAKFRPTLRVELDVHD